MPAAKANLSDEPIEDCVKKLDMLSDKEKYMLVLVLVLESVISSIRKLDAPVAQLWDRVFAKKKGNAGETSA